MLTIPLWTPLSSPKLILTSCTNISLHISRKVCVSDSSVNCVLSEGIRRRHHRSGFSDSYQGCYLPNAKWCQTATLESDFGPHMAGSVSNTSLTPLSFQSPQTLEHRHDRSLPASHVNSSKNSRQTCTMNCYGGPIIHQRTKVRRSAPPS